MTKNKQSEMDRFFVPENARQSKEEISPDGKYKLVITSFITGKNSWNYTQGLVYKIGNELPILEVKRNYSSFPFLWIDHPNGHQYLICGANYQGQTVLELDTEKRIDFLPKEAKQGLGFCWIEYRFNKETCILTVLGCIWACPDEFRFYDFSDPINNLPWLEIEDNYINGDDQWPTFETDGTIQTYSTEENDTEDGIETWRATKIFKREGLKLVFLREYVSVKEI